MITVHDAFAAGIEPTGLGLGAVFPTECLVTEEAGGCYALTLTHPIDAGGAWKLLRPLNLLCVPVPVCRTPMVSASEGEIIEEGLEVWRAGAGGAGFYRSTAVTRYPAYVSPRLYAAGDRMRWEGTNYLCVITHAATPVPSMANWRSQGSGAPRPVLTLAAGTQFTVSENSGTWLTVRLQDGTKGYCRADECEYMYTAEEGSVLPGDVDARRIAQQLFRITDVEIAEPEGTVRCSAQHISYDWSAALVGAMILDGTALPTAAAALRSAVMRGEGEAAPNLYVQETGSPVTGSWRRVPVTSVLLDPDSGFVGLSKAMLVRDNRDFFLLRNEKTDRGYRIACGVNLTGVRWRRDWSRLVTRICPVAKAADGSDLLLPERFVDSERIGDYPFPMLGTVRVDARVGKDGLTEEEVLARMRAEARRVFEADGADLPRVSLTVDFLMLGDTEEYRQYRALDSVCLYDTVEVLHPDIGLAVKAQVRKYEWDAVAERLTRLELGDVCEKPAHTVAGYDLGDGCVTARKLSRDAIDAIRGELKGSE